MTNYRELLESNPLLYKMAFISRQLKIPIHEIKKWRVSDIQRQYGFLAAVEDILNEAIERRKNG